MIQQNLYATHSVRARVIQLQDPFAVTVATVVLVVTAVVLPIIKTKRIRITRSKILAVVIVFAYCLSFGSLAPLLIFLWPESFIWFPEYWGKFRGRIWGPPINESSPPIIVSALGWFLLIPFPIIVIWVSGLWLAPIS